MSTSKPPPPGEKAQRGLARYRDTLADTKRRDIEQALRDLRKANAPISVAAVAKKSGVSRKTIYKHKDLLATIDQYRNTNYSNRVDDHPSDRESTIVAGLRRKIAACQAENKALKAVVSDQRRTIELLYGQLDQAPPSTVTDTTS